jgi:ribosomal protein L11 methylase PrmA
VLAPEGVLVLSGLQGIEQRQSIETVYQQRGMKTTAVRSREEWWALQLEKAEPVY